MLKRFFSIYSLLLILSLCLTQPLYAKTKGATPLEAVWGAEYCNSLELRDPVASLFLHLITRPVLTAESDITLLVPAVNEAALSFRKTLFQGPAGVVKHVRFSLEVKNLVNVYRKDYAVAPEGIAGAEARGKALDGFLEGIIMASVRSGIPIEDLDLALLQGCATVERAISQRPLSTRLSETNKELIRYLLRFTVHQERRRILLESTREALRNIQASEEVRALYDSKIFLVFKPALSSEPIGLETFLADPANINDPARILMSEFNLEAISDMFAMKYAMELYFFNNEMHDALITSIVDGIPGMTPDLLREQLAKVHGLSFTPLAAYASISPSLPIVYSPLSVLADRLAVLGETPPVSPDLSLFSSTYQALLQFHYDIMLSDMITAREWTLAFDNNPDPTRPLSLSDQYAVKALALERSAMIRMGMKGMSEKRSRALIVLLQALLQTRV